MTTIKRITSFMMIILIIAMLAPYGYANGYSISIQNNNSSVSINNTVYNAYMLFEAVENNPGSYVYNPATCLPVSYTPSGGGAISGTDLLNWLSDPGRTTAELHDFSTSTYNSYIDVSPAPTPSGNATASGQQATISLTNPGYFIVTGGGESAENHSPITALASLTVANPTSVVNPKLDAPQVEKQVYHDNIDDFTSYSDHAIGDDIEYEIYATVPATTGYADYNYIITDTLVDGLDFNNDLTMTVNSTSGTITFPPVYYTVAPLSMPNNGFTLTIDIIEAIDAGLIAAGDTLVANFTANLNEGAVVDPDGTNDNSVKLDYSNNPQELVSIGSTPTSITKSSTFRVQLTKVNISGTQLEGAEFVLSLSDQLTTNAYGEITNAISLIRQPANTYTLAPSDYVASITTTITAGSVEILGLNSNTTYYLHEITPPSGYVSTTIPTSFTLQAAYNDVTGDLLPGYPTMLVNDSTTPISPVLDIVNYQGRELPDTGSNSTLILVTVGVTLLIAALIVLFILYRSNKKW